MAASRGVSAIQQSHHWLNGAKQNAQRKPVEIAASHGQSRNALVNEPTIFSAATLALGAVAFPFRARIYRIAQIFRISGVHSKKRFPGLFDRSDVHFVRENVTLIDQARERIEDLGGFHAFDAIQKNFPIHLRAGEADFFQKSNFTAIKVNVATHAKTLRILAVLSSSL
jgi:hypothetical protein